LFFCVVIFFLVFEIKELHKKISMLETRTNQIQIMLGPLYTEALKPIPHIASSFELKPKEGDLKW